MSKKKLLKILQDFFDADQREQLQHVQQIKKVLKKLKEKEIKMKGKMDACDNVDDIAALQQELDIIYAQRLKGVKIIKEIK
ncbi:MAG: hypothetical protein methR_P2518 [Methyloprofundus sp.]|nr:MAG: hypothetical protein methR_P2518 [Methyloprofundus sp.]